MTIFEYNPAASGFVFNVEWKETTKISCGFLSFLLLLLLLLKSNCWAGNVIRLDGRNQRSLSRLVSSLDAWTCWENGRWRCYTAASELRRYVKSLGRWSAGRRGDWQQRELMQGERRKNYQTNLISESNSCQFVSLHSRFFWSERKTERKEGFCYLIFL